MEPFHNQHMTRTTIIHPRLTQTRGLRVLWYYLSRGYLKVGLRRDSLHIRLWPLFCLTLPSRYGYGLIIADLMSWGTLYGCSWKFQDLLKEGKGSRTADRNDRQEFMRLVFGIASLRIGFHGHSITFNNQWNQLGGKESRSLLWHWSIAS